MHMAVEETGSRSLRRPVDAGIVIQRTIYGRRTRWTEQLHALRGVSMQIRKGEYVASSDDPARENPR